MLNIFCSVGLFVERSPSAQSEFWGCRTSQKSRIPISFYTFKIIKCYSVLFCRPIDNFTIKLSLICIFMLHENLSSPAPRHIDHKMSPLSRRPVTRHGRRHQNNDLPAGSCGYFNGLHRGVFRPGNESYWFSLSKRAASDEQLGAAGRAGHPGWYLDQLSCDAQIRHQDR